MKKIILTTIVIVLTANLFAQKTDTTKIKIGKTKIVILKNNNDKVIYHIVKKGETLYSISKKHNILIKDLLKNNPSLGNKFEVGMTLEIPNNNSYNNNLNHIVKKGETLYSISKKYDISIKELLKNNPSLENKFEAGMMLEIPSNNPKEVIVYKKKNISKEEKQKKLENGLIEFEQILKEKQKELKKHEAILDSLSKELANKKNDDLRKKEEVQLRQEVRNIKELAKEIAALDKGVDNIEEELDELEDKDFDNWNLDTEWTRGWEHYSPFKKKKKRFRGHWAGLEIGLNNYMNNEYSVILKDNNVLFELDQDISWTAALNFVEYNIPFANGVGLTTGMGTTWNSYHFRNNVNIYENTDGVITAEEDVVNDYSKNALSTWYLTVPLIFEFQIPVAKMRPGIHIGAGVVGSVKMHSERKTEFSDNISEHKIKEKTDFQIPALKYGLTFRVGYKFINLFANYDIVPLFKKDRGPEVFPFSVGLVLLDF